MINNKGNRKSNSYSHNGKLTERKNTTTTTTHDDERHREREREREREHQSRRKMSLIPVADQLPKTLLP
jgi:hypothetical protein